MSELYEKFAKVLTDPKEHQTRLVDKLRASGGLLVAHGLGSGKTLSSINAKDQLGVGSEVVVPAPLQANYDKELVKHLGKRPQDVRVRSYEKAVRDGDLDTSGLVVFDEAHRGRNAGTGAAGLFDKAREARYRMFLTGTPVYNQPADLANLLNAAAGRKVLPDDPNIFKQTFVGEKTVEAPLWDRLKGRVLGHPVDTQTHPTLINRERLVNAAKGYVDVYRGGGAGFPDRVDEEHRVTMSPEQWKYYRFAEGQMPWYLRAKIRAGLPMDKKESKELNAFQGALRQISNTPRGFSTELTDDDEHLHTPKIQKMVDHILEARKNDPNHRGVVYSNFLDSGINPMSRALTRAGVAHSVFTGEASPTRRAQMVADYNSGKTPVLLLSGAGSEGLDLKGTKTIQLMEPHWNQSRIDQTIGRGIRYGSHDHLPANERKVRVMRYFSEPAKDLDDRLSTFIGMKPKKGIEDYLFHMSSEKDRLTREIAEALQEASDAGPLQKRSAHEKLAISSATLKRLAPDGHMASDIYSKLFRSHGVRPPMREGGSLPVDMARDAIRGFTRAEKHVPTLAPFGSPEWRGAMRDIRNKNFQRVESGLAASHMPSIEQHGPSTQMTPSREPGAQAWTDEARQRARQIRRAEPEGKSRLTDYMSRIVDSGIYTAPEGTLRSYDYAQRAAGSSGVPGDRPAVHSFDMPASLMREPGHGEEIRIPRAMYQRWSRNPSTKIGEEHKTARAGLSDEVLEKVLARMGDATLGSKGNTKHIEFAHPAGVTIQSLYDADFIRSKIDSDFDGNTNRYSDQVRDDLLNMGYATLGSIAKKNQQRQGVRAINGGLYGSLAGSTVTPLLGLLAMTSKRQGLQALGQALTSPVGYIGGALLGGHLGHRIGEATYKPLGTNDVIARNTHPLLLPPKPVKAKVKLDVKER